MLTILAVTISLPIMPYTDANCHTEYESYMSYAFPCGFLAFCLDDGSNVRSVLMSSATLFSGHTANSASTATANYSFGVDNSECTSTYITSLFLWNGNNTAMISSWDNSTNPTSMRNLIEFSRAGSTQNDFLPEASLTSFVYCPTVLTGSIQPIIAGDSNSYLINFNNG